ncbi:cadherin-16-like [Gracilinanus agilis]|uniref:cadherin-16-like n=1 Tax=Gracilinanus agilis TaxID=191870 RepID=UPI001CFEA1E8|nr:cadherin-16-like [Gracilinanus agilis]
MEGMAYSDPLVLTVFVTDENDNPPNCPLTDSPSEVLELSSSGTEVTRLQATDADDPNSPNAHVVYKLLSQEPPGPEGSSFSVDLHTGAVMVQDTPLRAGELYKLLVLAADLAGEEGGLSSTCEVSIKVMDVNDHAPVFSASQYGPVSLPEDTVPGTRVATVTATDADLDPAYTLIDFSIVEGDPNGTFVLDSDQRSGHADVRLQKVRSLGTAVPWVIVAGGFLREQMYSPSLGLRVIWGGSHSKYFPAQASASESILRIQELTVRSIRWDRKAGKDKLPELRIEIIHHP